MPPRSFASVIAALAIFACQREPARRPAPAPPPPKVARAATDLGWVCKGSAFPDAPAFDASTNTTELVELQAKYLDEKNPDYRAQDVNFMGKSLNFGQAQVVACLDVKRLDSARTTNCGNGFQIYDSELSLRVVEVKTAKVLATASVTLGRAAGTCHPSSDRGGPNDFGVGEFDTWVFAQLLPFFKPPTRLPMLVRAGDVCAGSPSPGNPAYDPASRGLIEARPLSADGDSALDPLFGPAVEDRKASVAAVACIRSVPEKKVRECKYGGGATLELHQGSYSVRVVELRTARLLAEKSFAAKKPTPCPTMWNFGYGKQKLLDPGPELEKFIATYGTVVH